MMKKLIVLLFFSGIVTSCEDVIEVDLNNAPPRLVVEANLYVWDNGGSLSSVKLTTTAPFFDNTLPIITNADVKITDENGVVYPFLHAENGIYTASLLPQLNVDYSLSIQYDGETYSATET